MPAVPRPKGKAKDIAESILGNKKKRSPKDPVNQESQEATEQSIRNRVEVDDAFRNRY